MLRTGEIITMCDNCKAMFMYVNEKAVKIVTPPLLPGAMEVAIYNQN